MDINFDKTRCTRDEAGDLWLALHVAKDCYSRARRFSGAMQDRLYTAKLDIFRNRRSLDANAYMWVLLGKIADAIGSDKDAVYMTMLERYGVYTHVIAKPAYVKRLKAEWRLAREIGEVTVNGKTGIQMQCYIGSSQYDSKEMSTLIDGVISEAEDLGIETATPAEITRMKEEWGK